ncbi:MAG TPA: taurine catabolism dioxygenase TauD [Gammaproteobacteria bacterium]|nr:taurine catabolism dioxygenase TauD [Gammaproteobacteria bacterium]
MPVEKPVYPDNPFDPDNQAAYETWKAHKLKDYPRDAGELVVDIDDPCNLSEAEREALLLRCAKTNMVIYRSNTGTDPDKRIPATLGAQLGLRNLDRNMGADDDGITALQVVDRQWRERYIPYTNRPIHWHTDGYYNGLDQQINSLLLHCVRPAAEGGENALLDHEIAYIRLRDMNPDFTRALMAPDAMTIPANVSEGQLLRPARSGPVFSSFSPGNLHMRYTARTHNVEWKDEPLTRAAVRALEALLDADDPFIFRLALQPGWGLVSNNVLHNRSGFDDNPDRPRLLYRLRYFERVTVMSQAES